MEEILKLIAEYAAKKTAAKTWTAGVDWVQYAGPYFDAEEYTESAKALLNGWLVLGENGIRFETLFPKLMGKKFGVLTNSGSSSNPMESWETIPSCDIDMRGRADSGP